MRQYEIRGMSSAKKAKKQQVTVEAESKQDIWNNPADYGFSKLFAVEEVKEVYLGNTEEAS